MQNKAKKPTPLAGEIYYDFLNNCVKLQLD